MKKKAKVTRGGAREGAGRKPKAPEEKKKMARIALVVEPAVAESFKAKAAAAGLSQAKFFTAMEAKA